MFLHDSPVRDRHDALIPPAFSRFQPPLPLPIREHSSAPLELYPHDSIDAEDPPRVNTKEILLLSLTGQPAARDHSATSAAAVAARFVGTHMDASRVASPAVMVRLLWIALSSRAGPERGGAECVTSIDLSDTALGRVGPNGPPLRFNADGNPIPGKEEEEEELTFFPDERQPRRRTSQGTLDCIAQRSLALAYVCPLLWIPGAKRFEVRELKCRSCRLTDNDAKTIAMILRTKTSGRHVCVLERIDLSFNKITDAGAIALKKAIKYNKHIVSIILEGNRIQDKEILRTIDQRLARNREGKSNWTFVQHMKWILKGK